VLTDRSGVEIDYCPTCRGVWLDRGELDKIIERAAADTGGRGQSDRPAPPVERPDPRDDGRRADRQRYDRDDRYDGDSGRRDPRTRRRGSLLGELVDF